jgi:hypothetical protein
MTNNPSNPNDPQYPRTENPEEDFPGKQNPDNNPGVNPDPEKPTYPNDQGGVQDNDRIQR